MPLELLQLYRPMPG